MVDRERAWTIASVAIALVAAGAFSWAVATHAAQSPTCSNGWSNGGLGGSGPAIGPPSEQHWGTHLWYNFSIQSAGGGLTLHELDLQFQDVHSTNLTPAQNWSIVVISANGQNLGAYSFGSNGIAVWTGPQSTPFAANEVIVLDTMGDSLSGDTMIGIFVPTGSCGYEGSTTVDLP